MISVGLSHCSHKTWLLKWRMLTQPPESMIQDTGAVCTFLYIMQLVCRIHKYLHCSEKVKTCPPRIRYFPCFDYCLCYGRWRRLMPLVVFCTRGIKHDLEMRGGRCGYNDGGKQKNGKNRRRRERRRNEGRLWDIPSGLEGIYITQTASSAHFCQVQMINENETDGPGVI